jgi:hypothetical protein
VDGELLLGSAAFLILGASAIIFRKTWRTGPTDPADEPMNVQAMVLAGIFSIVLGLIALVASFLS